VVAYNFKPQFELPIIALVKLGTIRAGRKRHAKPGEVLQLYTGMRTKKCRLIATAQCSGNDRIQISFEHQVIVIGEYPNRVRLVAIDEKTLAPLDEFARGDGFTDFQDMARFWGPKLLEFEGRWIQWRAESVMVQF
jgi:hypothetical protein